MARNKVIDCIVDWLKPEIYDDVYSCNTKEWADNLLYTLETEYGVLIPGSNTDIKAFKKEMEYYKKIGANK